LGTSALRITSPFCCNRPAQKKCGGLRKSNTYLTHARKKVKFLSYRKVCKRPPTTSAVQSTPLRKGRQHGEKSKNFSHIIRLMTIRPRRCQSRWRGDRLFNPHPIRGDKRCLFGQQSDSSRKPHRKGVLLPVLTQLQQSIQRFRCKRVQLFVQGFRLK